MIELRAISSAKHLYVEVWILETILFIHISISQAKSGYNFFGVANVFYEVASN